MTAYTVTINHGNGIIGTYRMDAKDKTEARKVTPFKAKIVKIQSV